ncbi:MAG TPA: histidine kinase [Flavobacteriales bacterium]|nr:histidine kinase [Flavobacteriales bacterium]
MKNKNYNWLYWAAQLGGWGLYFGLSIFMNYSTGEITTHKSLYIFIVVLSGLVVSHLFRLILVKNNIISKPIQQQVLLLLLIITCGALVQSGAQISISMAMKADDAEANLMSFSLAIVYLVNWFIIFLLWMMLYVFYQFVERARSKFINELKLTALRNEIELTNLRTQLNPHFMFNSMNSIRALIDENPTNAKTAVTKLATLLRSTLQLSKRNYISLKEEIEIVNDYLYLEKMRFEERLEFTFDIDPNMHEVKFPPLMLQTVVENAIKHGISKLTEGGKVTVSAKKENENYIIQVTNPGTLEKTGQDNRGIGLLNTLKRLRLLYGKNANVELFEKDGKVFSELRIPVKM